jgi:4-oxalocrotonate tautomerase
VAKAPVTNRTGHQESAPFKSTTITENDMPIVTIQVTREGTQPGNDSVTAQEKAKLIEGVSQVLLNVLNKPLDSTFVVIEEVDMKNWGWGGLPVEEFRKQRALKAR